MSFLQVIDNVLTSEECKYYMNFIDEAEEKDNVATVNRVGYSNYKRITDINEQFADKLFQRVKDYLPMGINAKRLNEYIRIAKYDEGGEFKTHMDGDNQDKYGYRSKYTLNIFLNDNFEAGKQIFS